MIWAIFVVLLTLWLLAVTSGFTMGGFVHVLLVVAVILAIMGLLQAEPSRRAPPKGETLNFTIRGNNGSARITVEAMPRWRVRWAARLIRWGFGLVGGQSSESVTSTLPAVVSGGTRERETER